MLAPDTEGLIVLMDALGQRQLGSRILCGARKLSKTHIRTLAEHFQVSADLFLD